MDDWKKPDRDNSALATIQNPHLAFSIPHSKHSEIRNPQSAIRNREIRNPQSAIWKSAIRNPLCPSLLLLCLSCSGRAQSLSDGIGAWQRGDYATAEKALGHVAAGGAAGAAVAYTRLLNEVGRYVEAEAAARKGNDSRLAVELCRALRLQGKYTDAEAAVAPSTLPTGRFEYAELLRLRGQNDKSRRIYQTIAGGPRLFLGRGRQGTPEKDADDIEDAIAMAQSLRRLEDFHGSNALYQDLLDRYPESSEIRLAWADLFLEKYNPAEASGLYQEVLKKNPHHPLALVGLAQCPSDSSDARVNQLLDKALEVNPKLMEAFQIRVHQFIEDEQYQKAADELVAAEKINAQDLDNWSLRGAVAFFTRQNYQKFFDQIASVNSHYGEAWLQLGQLCASHKRFEQAAEFFRKAIETDPRLWRAYAALGINLLRLGEDRAGKEALERAYAGDPFNIWTVNTLRLLDSFKYYRDSQTPHFRVRIHTKEEVLRDLAEDLLEKSYRALSQRYQFEPAFRTSVEFYPNHEDFAVRTLGVPGLGALGATFGKVIALDSPAARKRGEYNWASTLWHEVTHVFTLNLSDMKVPRWLTEGLSTYEERLARPGWGKQIDPMFVQATEKGRLLPLKDLSAGFLHPKYPEQMVISYEQASLVSQYLVEQYGWEKMRRLLAAFRDKSESDAFPFIYGKPLDRLEAEFQAYLKPRVERVAAQLNENSASEYLKQVRTGEDHFKNGNWEKAAEAYRRAITLEPEPRYPVSVYFRLAQAEEKLEKREAAMDAYLKAGQLFETEESAFQRAFDLALKLDRRDAVATAYENLLFLYPADSDLHLAMGQALLKWNQPEQAVIPLKRATELSTGDAAQAHYLLGRAYWAAGKPDLARKAVLAALDIAPAFEKAQQLLLQIAEGRK
jgi:tetratricopeptide (TPR) repeat protein